MISRIAILPFASVIAGFCWRVAHRAHADWKRRMRLLEMELRLADAFESFYQEVFRLKQYRVLRPNASGRNAAFIPSTNVSSLRYIKGRENED
ncbi:MAG: hypothetical protein JWO19_2172 [Bryobacterales bacterium]|nr:hypothetical protein [Bryobacterales bacterium]